MHPSPQFHGQDREMAEAILDEIGFGMIFATTPDGPRVAHTPLLSTGDGTVQFHLARGNALTRWLDGENALVVVNGPDGYISARWYSDPAQVPTWNYVAVELEGRVRRMDGDGLIALLEGLSARHEARISSGTPWTMDKLPEAKKRQLLAGIIGFELEVSAWRATFKLSQNKPADKRARLVEGLEGEGARGIAALMRSLAP